MDYDGVLKAMTADGTVSQEIRDKEIGAWEALVRSGSIDSLFLSSPYLVVQRLIQMFATGEIWPHLLVSGREAGVGFGLVVAVGIPMVITKRNKRRIAIVTGIAYGEDVEHAVSVIGDALNSCVCYMRWYGLRA